MHDSNAYVTLDSVEDCADDVQGQAMDILAGLTSLGISEALREKVQNALSQLDQASSSAAAGIAGRGKKGSTGGSGPASPTRLTPAEVTLKKQVEALDKKLAMSRSIMRKLYHKNVELEKELRVSQVNSQPITSVSMVKPLESDLISSRPATALAGLPAHLAAALQERDQTIAQLQLALESARRRNQILESQFGAVSGSSLPPGTVPQLGGLGMAGAKLQQQQQQGIRDVLAQSALHLTKYQQIRDDYNRLLYKRTSAISSSKTTTQEAKSLVGEVTQRLTKEIQEREAEAALYSARLYESEKQMSDWYVEKRLLEQQISRLKEEVAQRDKLDSEMEVCLCGMFERLRLLEETNAQLTARLEQAGVMTSDTRTSTPQTEMLSMR
ncbi:hypothetical protein CEUSTIGMA_g9845.t1 [Chlamydomonas eustigma]|uniref:Uncharacterized protein n=1 Tax=Chlamydomonas eustigma TaxID=1157962 RepID=A0A250XH63_9CHLO|nr:hypothetical protein CEUSTIGMA_g9845.t1 [Chlamydomonas eustigma]|eukprot:GAX82417.1 hypothetical protein CEUSTIGMA_g9845.t1 [Chlamydomonas eustigma]